jgi:hypothetical protein
MDAERCIADDCDKPAEGPTRKYCRGHRARAQQQRPLTRLREYGTDPAIYLKAKALEYADASDAAEDNERAFALAWKRLMYAAVAYVRRKQRQKVPRKHKTP